MRRVIKVKPRFWICFIGCTMLLFSVLYAIQANTMNSQLEQLHQLEQYKVAQMSENEILKQRIDFSKTDEYVERYARRNLGLLKEGEIRFVSDSSAE